jgi:hypothetical protein
MFLLSRLIRLHRQLDAATFATFAVAAATLGAFF